MQTADRKDTSILVKPAAIIIWLVVCVIAVLYEKNELGVLAGAIFFLTLSSYMWARAALTKTDFDLKLNTSGMFPGQKFTVTRIVRNRKTLPMLWVEIREPCELSDPAAPIADVIVESETYNEDDHETVKFHERLYTLSLIKWHKSMGFKDEWEAKRRGIMEIGASIIRSGDGMGLCSEERRFVFPAPRRIVVYPRQAQVSAASILNDIWDTRSESGGFLKDRTTLKTIRDYLPGDAARDVNMRLLARGQGLKTNVYETVAPDTVLFVLDSGSFRECDLKIFEQALSVLAALIEELTSRGILVALMAPESKWFPELCTQPSSEAQGKYRMFEVLAAASQEDPGFAGTAALPDDEPGRVYIVCADESSLTLRAKMIPLPDYKVLCLKAGEAPDGGGAMRTLSLFGFERTA